MSFEPEDLTKIIDALIKIAPGAGMMIVASICLAIMKEKPSDLLRGLAALLWGWKKRNGNGSRSDR